MQADRGGDDQPGLQGLCLGGACLGRQSLVVLDGQGIRRATCDGRIEGGPGPDAPLEDAQARAPRCKASDQEQGERGSVSEASSAVLICGHRLLGDLEAVREHVDE